MSMYPDPTRAAPMLDTPPDSQEMTFGEHLNAVLVAVQRGLQPDEQMQFKAFFMAVDELGKKNNGFAAQPAGPVQQQPQQPGASPGPGAVQEYGEGAGEPVDEGRYAQ